MSGDVVGRVSCARKIVVPLTISRKGGTRDFGDIDDCPTLSRIVPCWIIGDGGSGDGSEVLYRALQLRKVVVKHIEPRCDCYLHHRASAVGDLVLKSGFETVPQR